MTWLMLRTMLDFLLLCIEVEVKDYSKGNMYDLVDVENYA